MNQEFQFKKKQLNFQKQELEKENKDISAVSDSQFH